MRSRVRELSLRSDPGASPAATPGKPGAHGYRDPADDTRVDRPRGVRLMRHCARCGEWRPTSGFHDSRTGQFSYCGDCRREYDRRYYAERGRSARLQRQRVRASAAREWLQALKADVPCADCRRIFPSFVMQWDHLPGQEKLGEISRLSTGARAVILREIAKCELVCANCHALRTARRATTRGNDLDLSGRSHGFEEVSERYRFGS